MKTKFYFYIIILSICTLFLKCKIENCKACNNKTIYFETSEPIPKAGGIKIVKIKSKDKEFNIWTKTIGNNPLKRVLLLNGGPGATHEYFECFESYFPKESIEFIYYDQLGCGNSDNPNDTSFWDLDRYVDELEQVRIALRLEANNFYLLGHSWGGIIAMQYALKYQKNLKGLVISNMMSDAIKYDLYAEKVLSKSIPTNALNTIQKLELEGQYTNPQYMKLLNEHFYQKHLLRMPINNWPEPVTRSFSKMNQSLYITMQGPSEFGISGKLEKWNIADKLKTILTPTLVIGAKYDTMDPAYMLWMSTQFRNGSYLFCPNGSHMCMWDDQIIYMNGLIDFIIKN